MGSLNHLLRWALQGLGISSEDDGKKDVPLDDGEIIFSKNNVCIHERVGLERIHHRGYFTLQCLTSDLHILWIPNQILTSTSPSLLLSRCGSNYSTCPSPSPLYYRPLSVDDIITPTYYAYSDGSGTSHSEDVQSLASFDDKSNNKNLEGTKSDVDSSGYVSDGTKSCGNKQDSSSENSASLEDSNKTSHITKLVTTDRYSRDKRASSGDHSQQDNVVKTVDKQINKLRSYSVDEKIDKKQAVCSLSEGEAISRKDKITRSCSLDEQIAKDKVPDNCSVDEQSSTIDEQSSKDTVMITYSVDDPTHNKDQSLNNYTKYHLQSYATDKDTVNLPYERKASIDKNNKAQNNESCHKNESTNSEQNNNSSLKKNTLEKRWSIQSFSSFYDKRTGQEQEVSIQMPRFRRSSCCSNLSFVPYEEDSASSTPAPTRRLSQPELFHVQLGNVRSLRVFMNSDGIGQLVVGSSEMQYKVMHFHHGGLDKLTEKLKQLPNLTFTEEAGGQTLTFTVNRSLLMQHQLHPEEGLFTCVDESVWESYLTADGCVLESTHLRKATFFAGVDDSLRGELWPFFLGVYPWDSTYKERELIFENKSAQYNRIREQREAMNKSELSCYSIIDKDVWRTDRTHPFYSGPDNKNVILMRNILLDYAVFDHCVGYRQGMSDMLAPVLLRVKSPAMAFWCLQGLIQQKVWMSSPTDIEMDLSLFYLRELMRVLIPNFYKHIMSQKDGDELLFCHRWLQLCLKREFCEDVAVLMWEACWAHYQTDFFHLFLCISVMSIYGDEVIKKKLSSDETLLYFSCLQFKMDGHVVLRKARGFLYQFRNLSCIPCTLTDLCTRCGPGIWDSEFLPSIICVEDHKGRTCLKPS